MSQPDFFRLLWSNGETIPVEAFWIHPADEGVLFGRGVFTTTRTWSSGRKVWFWQAHCDRLLESAAQWRIALDPTRIPTEADLIAFVGELGAGDVVLRVNVSAGPPRPQVWCVARPLPPPAGAMRLAVSPYRVSRSDPTAALKTFNYGLRRLAQEEAAARGFDDALLLDEAGELLETSRANIFVRFSDGWRTPPLDGAVLPGVVRAELIRRFPICEAAISISNLDDALAVFTSNSGRGVVGVQEIDQRRFNPGGDVAAFQQALTAAAVSER